MHDFNYNVIKKQYGERAKLLFTDTDSLCYEIETEDIYDNMYNNKALYDLSDYSDDHDYYKNNNLSIDVTNKKVIGKFKDETDDIPIIEFIGLRSKMYNIKLLNEKEKKRTKSVKKNVINNDIKHVNYKNVINGDGKYGFYENSLVNVIRSKFHDLYTYTLNKIGLSTFDDKRYVLNYGKDTLAHGHYKINVNNN